MKAIRFIGMVVLTIVMGLNFSSCSNDDDDSSSPENVAANLEGTWVLVKETGWYYSGDIINGEPSDQKENYDESYDPNSPKTDSEKWIISKTDDNTYAIKAYTYDYNSWGDPENGKYDVTTKTFTSDNDSEFSSSKLESLNGTTMVVKTTDVDPDNSSRVVGENTQTFTRMK